MNAPVTIDNLPVTDHSRWAVDQSIYEKKLVEEAGSFFQEVTESLSITPQYESQFINLLGINMTNVPWAHFPEPRLMLKRRYFSRRGVLPGIHSEELLEKFLTIIDNEENEGRGRERARKRLLAFMEKLREIEKLMLEAYTRVAQIQRG